MDLHHILVLAFLDSHESGVFSQTLWRPDTLVALCIVPAPPRHTEKTSPMFFCILSLHEWNTEYTPQHTHVSILSEFIVKHKVTNYFMTKTKQNISFVVKIAYIQTMMYCFDLLN